MKRGKSDFLCERTTFKLLYFQPVKFARLVSRNIKNPIVKQIAKNTSRLMKLIGE